MTAKEFISTLKTISLEYSEAIPKREIFALAKEFIQTPVPEVIKVIQDKRHDHHYSVIASAC